VVIVGRHNVGHWLENQICSGKGHFGQKPHLLSESDSGTTFLLKKQRIPELTGFA
jgi:hypothetical protein